MTDKNTQTVPYDFSDLYANAETMFKDRGYDTTESSDISQLITSMSYMVSMLNANTSVNVNEMILTEAKERDNVFLDARAFGYEAQHITSYRYTLTLTLGVGSHVIPKYARFEVNGKFYYYFGAQLEYTNITYELNISIDVVEGVLHSYTDTDSLSVTTVNIISENGVSTPQYYVDIPFTDVEDSSIEVYVTYYNDEGRYVYREAWTKAQYYVIDDSTVLDKEFVRADDIEFKTPRLYFKYAGTGIALRAGSTVEMNVLVSSGSDGAIEDLDDTDAVKFTFDDGATCTGIRIASIGQPEETIASVKANAPKFYNSANRCVTASDYQSFCDRQTTVYQSLVWGGDDEYPKVPGHLWFTFAPTNYVRNFTYEEHNDNFFFTYHLDDSDGVTWDYSLISDNEEDEDAYNVQYNAQQLFYSKRYIQNDEIRSTSKNDHGDIIDEGVWDVIDKYKVPTLDFHNRNPLYVYFDYDVSILKYSISDSKEEIHSDIFDNVDGYFTGTGDLIKAEDFSVDYYNSTLDQRIYEILGDHKGYDLNLTTSILLNEKTVSTETASVEIRDIYIPLAIPFENYFDSNGFLMTDVLPSIDTADFINYNSNTEIGNIYTDWSVIQEDIDNGITQEKTDLLAAKIRCDVEKSYIITQEDVDKDNLEGRFGITFEHLAIQCDDIRVLDDVVPNPTYNNTVLTKNGVVVPYNELNGWYTDFLDNRVLYLVGIEMKDGDVIKFSQPQDCGTYYLFNDFKKYIQVHLFVNGYNYNDDETSETPSYTSPKSYFYSSDGKYINTEDTYYITSEGYVTSDEYSVDDSTIVSTISLNNYKFTPLSMNLFRQSRFLNLDYENDSFSVIGNMMPRLRSVNFEKRV